MTKRALAIALLAMGGWGCSSSSSTKDAATDAPKDTAGDATAGTGGGSAAGAGGGGSTGTAGSDAGTADATDTSVGDASDASDAPVVLTPLQARGQYIVDHVAACGDCHTPQGAMGPDLTKYLAGNASFAVIPTNGHKLGTRNLTNDETGLKNRTDAEIKAMFMDGKRPAATGTEALNPIMPYYVFHNMTSADGDAVVAYLRTVKGVSNMIPRRDVEFDVAAPANYLDPAKIPMPAGGADGGTDAGADGGSDGGVDFASALRGRYLATQAGVCIECHTPHQMGADVLDPTKFFEGGEDFSNLFATTLMIHPVSKNLTSDSATGLGTWTAADIVKAIKMGKAKDGSGICPPMPVGPMGAFGLLKDEDALDIANYIKSLPPIVHNVPDMCVFPPVPPSDGGTDAVSSSDGGADAVSSSDAGGN